MKNNPHFPFLPEDSWKKKAVEESRRAIIAHLQYERAQRINSLILEQNEPTGQKALWAIRW